ncbi:MAG: hypothetical protein IJT73_09930 [Selenomonadaceae bacterium]|nr:hypothetical protein [Selenomonadaceae bacterium]
MKKILLAYNPISGSATFKKNLDELIEKFQRRNILLTKCERIFGAAGVI